jgi:hypothetical protein
MGHFRRRQAMLCLLTIGATIVVSASYGQQPIIAGRAPQAGFAVSFAPGSHDDTGRFMGGTEMRVLAAHAGRLYAGNGYWEDQPGPEGLQGAEILVLDRPGDGWRVDYAFDERMPSGRPRGLAVSALEEIAFATDANGKPMPAPVRMLIAAVWDLTGAQRVFSRDDASGRWSGVTLAFDRPRPNFLPQVRSFGEHRDRLTRIDLVFAGDNPRGIFSGSYDASLPGHIRWNATPELGLSDVSTSGLSGANAGLRVSSFSEANGRLYAAIGQQVYERIDGASAHWQPVYTNPNPGHSETGLRGLTAIPDPSGYGQVLLAAVEGSAGRILRIDPRNGSAVTELDLPDFLARRWRMPVSYVIAAYNDMANVPDPGGGEALLIGIEAFVPRRAPIAAGHDVVDVGYGRLEAGGWYLVRHPNGNYDLRQILAPGRVLVATRAIRQSPFPQEGGAIYFAGYDANKAPAHNTSWIFHATAEAAIPPAR